MNIRIQSFSPRNNTEFSEQFRLGHQRVLSDYGIENVTSNSVLWANNKHVHALVALNLEDNSVVGGIRIHMLEDGDYLPVMMALNYIDPNVSNWVRSNKSGEAAEICGLWNAKRVFGRGISFFLTRAAIAYCMRGKFKTLIGLAAPYTKEMSESLGFRVVETVGLNGTFLYPNERHLASLMCFHLSSLDTMVETNRILALSLKNNPVQEIAEMYNGKTLFVEYNLTD